MHNHPSSLVEHSLQVTGVIRPIVAAVASKDRDLASQIRRAASSVPLNLSEGFGSTGGNARLRFQTALGSLREAHTAIRVAVEWGYVSQAVAAPALAALHAVGGRVYGLTRR